MLARYDESVALSLFWSKDGEYQQTYRVAQKWVKRMAVNSDLEEMSVSDIMRYWPSTVRVFLDLGMLCVGCPIGGFHTLANAAYEHGLDLGKLKTAIDAAISAEVLQT